MNINKIISTFVIILCCSTLSAQTYVDSEGLWFIGNFQDTAFVKHDAHLLKTVNDKSAALPFEIGQTVLVNNDIISKGKWFKVENGNFIWQLLIKVENASALNIYLSNIQLKADELLLLKGIDGRALEISSKSNISSFGTSPFKGNIIQIQLVGKSIARLPFKIREIGIIEKSFDRDFGDAAFCEVSVNCPEGDDYQKIKNSVARILVKQGSSLFWCTGSLINNTSTDGTPYFLTANHCGNAASEQDYSDWVFDFNFESPDCDMPALEPAKNTVYGSRLLAKAPEGIDSYSDFKLLLLKQDPPPEAKPFYVGWDRRGLSSVQGVGIHHPQGDIKMISTYSQSLVSTDYHNKAENGNGLYWKVNWSETQSNHGVTEGGSSGSPLYNKEGLLIGTLTGGDASCNFADDPDWYGKFSYHWESNGGDSATTLKYWLDPLNSNAETLNGTDLDTNNITANFTVESNDITLGSGLEFTNLSQGGISSYEWYFEGGAPETSTEKNPGIIRYYNFGSYDVKLIVRTGSSSDSMLRTDFINVSSNVFPTVTARFASISVGSITPDKITLSIFSGSGTKVRQIDNPQLNDGGYLKVDLQEFRAGPYFIRLNIEGYEQAYKVILVKE